MSCKTLLRKTPAQPDYYCCIEDTIEEINEVIEKRYADLVMSQGDTQGSSREEGIKNPATLNGKPLLYIILLNP